MAAQPVPLSLKDAQRSAKPWMTIPKNMKRNSLLWPFLIALSLSLVTADGISLKAGAGQPNRGQKKGPKAVYEGVLPCADCEGIKTELTLYRKAESSDPATYRLSETYLGRR